MQSDDPRNRRSPGWQAVDEDALSELVASLTLGEKLDRVSGDTPVAGETGYLDGIERLGVPPISLVDGPSGVRDGKATAFPAPLALAATFDRGLAAAYGRALGGEAREKGHDVVLAPALNIVRVPQCGRAFEYLGEDPALTAGMATALVSGIQSAGVVATAKHYVANNQEEDRMTISAEVGDRALREIYLRGFEATVKTGDVGAVMLAYNRVNGTDVDESRWLLTDVLKADFGFEGFVVSDWWSLNDPIPAANAGLDLEMPGVSLPRWVTPSTSRLHRLYDIELPAPLPDPIDLVETLMYQFVPDGDYPREFNGSLFGEPLAAAVQSGELTMAVIDEMVRRVLRVQARFGMLAGDDIERPGLPTDTLAPGTVARRVARRGMVLLKNDGVLPIDTDEPIEVAVVGPNADRAKLGGGGSSEVAARETTSPLAGIRERIRADSDGASGTRVRFERGVPRISETRIMHLELPSVRDWFGPAPKVPDAVAAANAADVAVVVVQDDAAEGFDRTGLRLPGQQDELVRAVAGAAARTVVVLQTSGAVTLPWLDAVDAVLQAWYPGQAHGRALADVLFGDADPGGRLPVTFGRRLADYPASTPEQYPGVGGQAHYSEGVFVGYRHFDHAAVDPLFPFGHGHSYTDFAYRDLELAGGDAGVLPVTARVPIENVGDRSGREVVQCYARPPGEVVERPGRELVAFESVSLDPGERRAVELTVSRRDVAYWDENEGDWAVESGTHEVLVGRSSRDVRVSGRFDVD